MAEPAKKPNCFHVSGLDLFDEQRLQKHVPGWQVTHEVSKM